MQDVTVARKTTESEMTVTLNFDTVRPDYRAHINTPLPFLNHMIEHLVWRGELNIDASVKLDKFYLTHVVCEDLGQTLGRAVAKAVADNPGAAGYGWAVGIIDEAKAEAAMSFEKRAYFDFDSAAVSLPHSTEGMNSEDLATFLDGFAQGAQCTLQVEVRKGVNGHHIWEAVFRAVGLALKQVLAVTESRKNMTSGVAGKVVFDER